MLDDLKIPQYISVFVEEELVTWDAIKELTEPQLKDLGLKMGPRNLILKYI